MKICYLADINSYHTKKWCEYFVPRGHDVHLISISNGSCDGVLELSLNISKKKRVLENYYI